MKTTETCFQDSRLLAILWDLGWTWHYSCQLLSSSLAGGGTRLRKFTSGSICCFGGLQPLWLHGSPCFQARNEFVSATQGWAGSLAPQLAWPLWHVLVLAAYEVETQLHTLLIQPAAPIGSCATWSVRQLTHPSYLSLPCLRLLWLTLKPVCFWAASVLWLLWARKPWRNAAEPGRMARTQARLCWVPIKMELLLLSFIRTCKCFGTEYISSENSFIAVPPLYSSNSSFLFPLFSLPLSLYPSGADIGLSELACFGKMQAQETA